MDTLTTDAVPVWANHATNTIDHPLTEWTLTGNLKYARVTAEMRNRVGNITFRPFVQHCHDPYDTGTWSSATLLGSLVSANGVTADSSLETANSTKRYVRFGVQAVNSSGALLTLCYALLRLDRRGG